MKKNILRRVKILYWVLITFIVLLLAVQFYSFAYGFVEGIKGSVEMAVVADKDYVIAPYVPAKEEFSMSINDFKDQIASSADSSVVVHATAASYNVLIEKDKDVKSGMEWVDVIYFILTLLSIVIYGQIIVFMFKVLSSIKHSLNQNTVFSSKVIRYTRWVGALLIVCSVFLDVATYLHNTYVMSMMQMCQNSIVEFSAGFPVSSYMGIITGVMILFFAEVFAIGYDISEEQKLTI
ncbi:MAG: DUF2975 domain-containing protein [Flavobacteriales bacterium]|nr:DUF2975 domain-containing protein [Flavobacteriales bacterium]